LERTRTVYGIAEVISEMKLLVIDDNEDITEVVKVYCESKHLDCTAINNGKDRLELIRKNNKFDLILLD
jgi:CheY-like chemotaxis protein